MNNILCVGVKVFETKDQKYLKSGLFDDFDKVFCILMVLKEKVKNPEATNMLHFVICCCGFSSRNSRTTAVDGGSV